MSVLYKFLSTGRYSIIDRGLMIAKGLAANGEKAYISSRCMEVLTKHEGPYGENLKCVKVDDGEVLAIFQMTVIASKNGTFELAPRVQGQLLDEVLISGIGAMECRIQ